MQRLERFEGETKKRFMLHYNFPPFSVGEVAFLRGAGRREIGHGALAERAISTVLPTEDKWPYAMRVVSDILESNGSSSMATVCGAALSLMDAGVPLKAPVAGVAMGLVKEGDDYAILTDIAGAEDHYGDMDFKVAGTKEGITALQMDIKVGGITAQIMREALAQAQRGRLFILGKMDEVLTTHREKVSAYAPRIYTLQIPVEGNRIRLSRKAILKEQRAKMGGGAPPAAPAEGGVELEREPVPTGAAALTIEGGAEFEEGDEPNFNRIEPQPTAAGAPERGGDRGGDRGGRGGRPGGGGGRPGGGGGGRHRRRDGRGGRGGHGGGGGGRH